MVYSVKDGKVSSNQQHNDGAQW